MVFMITTGSISPGMSMALAEFFSTFGLIGTVVILENVSPATEESR
jgi:hypothetical protein